MSDDQSIVKGIGRGLKSVVEETAEKLGEEGQKILRSTITGEELLGLSGAKMTNEEIAQKQAEDERHKQAEINKLRNQMNQGKQLEKEMEQIKKEKEGKEEQEEKEEENKERKEYYEDQQQDQDAAELMAESSNPSKQKKSRGDAFGRKKKHQPDQSQMSQTQEFKGKVN